MQETNTVIFGKHAVEEGLRARPDVVRTIFVEDGQHADVVRICREYGIAVNQFNLKKLPSVSADTVHQGIAAEIDLSKLVISFDEFIKMYEVGNDTAFALLGEVQDPQNVGAIIRSAAAFGIGAILFPEHRQAQINGTIIKVSAGMAFRIPLVKIGNVNQTIKDLKDLGFWVYGLDGTAKTAVADEQFEKPSVFVIGNEGAGIREKTLEHCDIPLRIPMHARAESLNAATSAAVVFYAWSVKHPNAL